MAIKRTTIGGTNFVVGLFWQSLNSGKKYKAAARKAAAEINRDLFIIREGQNAQAGFASRADGYAEGDYSLAAAISKGAEKLGIDGSWIGVFELPDNQYAVFLFNEGKFLPNGDIGCDEDEVKEQLTKSASFGLPWGKVILPEKFKGYFPKAEYIPIQKFLPMSGDKVKPHSWWKLQDANKRFPKKVVYGSLGAIGLIGLGYIAYLNLQEQEQIEQAKKLAMAQELFKQQLNKPVEPVKLSPTWGNIAVPDNFTASCLSQITESLLHPNGWSLDTYTCDGSKFTVKWLRSNSTVNHLLSLYPNAIIDATSDSASLAGSIALDNHSTTDGLVDDIYAKSNFISYFQTKRLSLKFNPSPEPATVKNENGVDVEQIRSWKEYDFQFTSKQSPLQFSDVLNYPVIRLTSIELKMDANSQKSMTPVFTWTVSGKMFTR